MYVLYIFLGVGSFIVSLLTGYWLQVKADWVFALPLCHYVFVLNYLNLLQNSPKRKNSSKPLRLILAQLHGKKYLVSLKVVSQPAARRLLGAQSGFNMGGHGLGRLIVFYMYFQSWLGMQKGFPMMYICLMCSKTQMRSTRYRRIPSVVD